MKKTNRIYVYTQRFDYIMINVCLFVFYLHCNGPLLRSLRSKFFVFRIRLRAFLFVFFHQRHIANASDDFLVNLSVSVFVDLQQILIAALGANRNDHSTAERQLIDERLRQRRRRGADMYGVERRLIGRAEPAVASANLEIRRRQTTVAFQVLDAQLDERLQVVDADNLAAIADHQRERRTQIAAAAADVERSLALSRELLLEQLQCHCVHVRRRNRRAMPDRLRRIEVRIRRAVIATIDLLHNIHHFL